MRRSILGEQRELGSGRKRRRDGGWGGGGREEMRELSVKAYTASIASFHQSIIHKSFSSQTLGKQGWWGEGRARVGAAALVLVLVGRRRETEGQSANYEGDWVGEEAHRCEGLTDRRGIGAGTDKNSGLKQD